MATNLCEKQPHLDFRTIFPTKKPGVVKLYKSQGYAIRAVDPGIFGWRGRLLMRKPMA